MPASSEINVISPQSPKVHNMALFLLHSLLLLLPQTHLAYKLSELTLCIMMHFSSLGVCLNFSLCNNLTMGKSYKFTKWATDSDHRKQTTGVKTPLNS